MTLGFEVRALVLALAAYALATGTISLLVALGWRWALVGAARSTPRAVARRLLALRCAPTLLGAATAGAVLASFLRFEPELGAERVAFGVVACAAVGASWIAASMVRLLRTLGAARSLPGPATGSRLIVADRSLDVLEVDTRFPIVALAGWMRPRLIVSRRVTEACSADEMAAMVAHEIAHLRAGDNFARAIFGLSPDLLAWMPAGALIERAWDEATEQSADEQATGGDERRRLALAAALVKVARLATACEETPLGVSALFRGEPISDRVRRLLDAPAPSKREQEWLPVALLAAVVLALLGAALYALPQIQVVAETAVRLGR